MTPKLQATLDRVLGSLRTELGDNLYSCCLYGSAVRGNIVEGVSDLNLLIVLNNSDCGAHQAVRRAISKDSQIDPFILSVRGLGRSVRCFATKFASIKRNYRVLFGADPLANLKIDPELEKFLCEQAVRNLRLRLVYAYVTRPEDKAYFRFVLRNVTALFVQFSEALRLSGVSIPSALEDRIPIFQNEFGVEGKFLADLLTLKRKPNAPSEIDADTWHQRLFPLVDTVLVWIETHWQNQSS
ncbi:MAG: hypothetical protein JWM99_1916 [Verrucomicrobiales bacterium]|nr:hypothetical protein [Verrucomicrobiales bacterium]